MKKKQKNSLRFRDGMALTFLLPLAVTGFATGNAMLLVLALFVLLTALLGLVSVLWTAATLELTTEADKTTIIHWDDISLHFGVRHRCILPVSAIWMNICFDTSSVDVVLADTRKPQEMETLFRAVHVGPIDAGIKAITITDIFGMFTKTVTPKDTSIHLLVLPKVFDVSPLEFSPGDAGYGTMARATEDLSNPTDIRSWQPGDPLKKIHWKLSQRKNELMVRKFEEPILAEALLLLDTSAAGAENADIRDTLLETAASVLLQPAEREHRLHLPLHGSHPMELTNTMREDLSLENIALADFSSATDFARILSLEMRRLRQVGCVVSITAQLSGPTVELLCAMRRSGPQVRVYYVTDTPDDQAILPFIHRLQQSGCDVGYVIPESA